MLVVIMNFEFSRAFCAQSIRRQNKLCDTTAQQAKNVKEVQFMKQTVGIPSDGTYFICLQKKFLQKFVYKNLHFFSDFAHCGTVMSDPNSPPTAPKMVPKDNLTFIELFFFSKISSLPYKE